MPLAGALHASWPDQSPALSLLQPAVTWVNAKALQGHLDWLAVPRPPGSQALADIRQRAVVWLQGHSDDVTVRWSHYDDTPVGPLSFGTVVARWGVHRPRRLVLAAHLDSKVEPAGFVGATDSAVPCAILLELARYLGTQAHVFEGNIAIWDVGVDVVLFDGEEALHEWSPTDSLYGSRDVAAAWSREPAQLLPHRGHRLQWERTRLDQVEVMVLLDLLGARDPWPVIRQHIRSTAPWFQLWADVEGQLESVHALSRRRMKQSTGYFLPRARDPELRDWPQDVHVDDDHRPFLELGVPCVHIIPLPFPAVWHTLADDRSAVDEAVMVDFAKLTVAFVHAALHLHRSPLH